MKIIFVILSLVSGFANSVMAMPCDTGYLCNSRSGKYSIEVQRCRYTNHLGNLISVKMNGHDVAGATLSAAWDGKSVGDSLLAFEITIPSHAGSSHVWSVEIPNKTKGIIKEKFAAAEPEPYTVIWKDLITCKVTD
jgi:hypothetical protein